MSPAFYADLVAETITSLSALEGAGLVLRAFGLGHSMAPDGVNDYDSRVRLAEVTNSVRSKRPDDARTAALQVLETGERFLTDLRYERLRQATWSFNAALALVLAGTAIVLIGTALLYRGLTGAGTITAVVGAVSNITSVLVFRLNRETNNRLDKISATLGNITARRMLLQSLHHDSSKRER